MCQCRMEEPVLGMPIFESVFFLILDITGKEFSTIKMVDPYIINIKCLLKVQVTFLKLCLLVVCLTLIIPRFMLF